MALLSWMPPPVPPSWPVAACLALAWPRATSGRTPLVDAYATADACLSVPLSRGRHFHVVGQSLLQREHLRMRHPVLQ